MNLPVAFCRTVYPEQHTVYPDQTVGHGEG